MHRQIGKYGARIAHGICHGIGCGVAETRIRNIPSGEACKTESHQQEQCCANGTSDLAAREGLQAVIRLIERKLS